jgi:hypothetical protein
MRIPNVNYIGVTDKVKPGLLRQVFPRNNTDSLPTKMCIQIKQWGRGREKGPFSQYKVLRDNTVSELWSLLVPTRISPACFAVSWSY